MLTQQTLAKPDAGRKFTRRFPVLAFLVIGMLIALGACSRKHDVKASLSELEKAFSPTAAPTQQLAPAFTAGPVVRPDAKSYVSAAISAVRANDYDSGVIALEDMQRMKGGSVLTANQLMAIEQAKRAIIADLVARADRGESKAKNALTMIERTHSQ